MKQTDKQKLLQVMLTSRATDEYEVSSMRQGTGWFCIGAAGHEALAALGLLLGPEDVVATHYRDRALALAKGLGLENLAYGFLGKRDATCRGRQMTSHFNHREHNLWSMPSPTPSSLLPACGIAWGMKLRNESAIVVAALGDGGLRQGEFYESVAFAAERQLPILFVIEDNHFAISTPTESQNPFRLDVFDARRATRVDGRDPNQVYEAASRLIAELRKGGGPHILWCEMDRLCSHTSSDDQATYRDAGQLEQESQNDPVDSFARQLIDEQLIDEAELAQIRQRIVATVADEYRKAEATEEPRREDLFDELIADPPVPKAPQIPAASRERMADAINAVFHDAITRDERIMFFGEDIEDPKGGVFKLTKGLSSAHPNRVFNSPLAEATIVGLACGLASHGMRPIFELQFIDFVGPAMNQLVNNLATLRWRSAGHWNCPAVIYAPCGAYLPGGGIWHSQAGGSQLAQLPGLRVAIPSTPDDAAGLFDTAIAADDPTLILLPKHLLWKRFPVAAEPSVVGFAESRLIRTGDDVTLVTWGNCVEVAERAADSLAGNLSVDLMDLRTVMPWDKGAIMQSLAKTGRLLIVQEERESCSLGQMIISWAVTNQETWDTLLCQPQLLSTPDIYIGFSPAYEEYCLPNQLTTAEAIVNICSL